MDNRQMKPDKKCILWMLIGCIGGDVCIGWLAYKTWFHILRGYISGSWIVITRKGDGLWPFVIAWGVLCFIWTLVLLVMTVILIRELIRNKED